MFWPRLTILLLTLAVSSNASVLYVPQDHATIQSAIQAAVEGDSIVVGPGYYQENLNFLGKGIKVVAAEGPSVTSLFQASPNTTLVTFKSGESDQTLLSGFSVNGLSGGPVIHIVGGASPTISDCIFSGYLGGGNQTLITCETDDALITRNIFYNNSGISCVGIWFGSARIINNTFDHNARGFFSITGNGFAYNNIVTHSTEYGIAGDFADVAYNDVWENGDDYSDVIPGPGSISSDPLFNDAAQHDYSLAYNSPCIDAGHPNAVYIDPDGTRSDIGALPFTAGNPPLPLGLQAYPNFVPGVVYIANPTISWRYWDNEPTDQVAYEAELSLDSADWSSPIWQSGEVFTSVSSFHYPGSPLQNDIPYYVRVRVFSGTVWGGWMTTGFVVHVGGTILVPEETENIQAALDAALPGDTISVAPGFYSVQLHFSGKRVIVAGRYGPKQTFLLPAVSGSPVVLFNGEETRTSVLTGFTIDQISGEQAILINRSSPTITGNIFRNFTPNVDNAVVISCNDGNPLISYNLFYHNSGISCIGIFSGSGAIVNNSFHQNNRGFFSLSGGVAINNIVTQSNSYGIAGNFDRQEYNLVWENDPNYEAGAHWNPGNLDVDPRWIDPNLQDYNLSFTSPCIDAGDPSDAYNDRNGTRNDMGAFPFDLDSFPHPGQVVLSPASADGRVQSPQPLISWSYQDSSFSTQQAFEIEVGTDNDWTFAEMWRSGTVYRSEHEAMYEGLPLEDGNSYWMRMRLYNGTTWGGWAVSPFLTRFVRVIHVPAEYSTISAAFVAAVDGDTVLVAPGTYTDYFDFLARGIKLISEGGPAVTILRTASGHGSVTDFHSHEISSSRIEGFTFEGGSGDGMVRIRDISSPTIRGNVFHSCTGEVVIRCDQSDPIIAFNVFYGNAGISCVGVYSGSAQIFNNTFDGNNRGFFSLTNQTVAKNNVVTNSRDYGIAGLFRTLTYNLAYNNNPNYTSGAVAGIGSLSADPRYLGPTSHDYHVQPGSPCIDAGDPAPEFNDTDGSRADMGAYPYVFPTSVHVRSVSFPGQEMSHITIDHPIIAWEYRSPQDLPQSTYDLEIGTDQEWSAAEMWTDAPPSSSATAVTYSGAQLQRGVHYYGRLRVSDGSAWSDWYYFGFRVNSLPIQPVAFSPNNAVLALSNLTFVANAGVEQDGDAQMLDFVLSTDPSLSVEVAHQNSVAVSNGRAVWNLTISLDENRQYYWGARAFDGYEYSDLSAVATFWNNKIPERPAGFSHIYPPTIGDGAIASVVPTLIWQAAIDPDPGDTITYSLEMATDSLFLFHFVSGGITDTFFTPTAALHVNTQYWWQVTAKDKTSNQEISGVGTFWTWMQGDIDLSRRIDLTDLSMMINYLIVPGTPLPNPEIGDLDGDCRIDLTDLARLIVYLTGQQVPFGSPCIGGASPLQFTRSTRLDEHRPKEFPGAVLPVVRTGNVE